MKDVVDQESSILPNQLQFDESFSSNVSANSDDDESPLVGMARLLRKNRKDAKKDNKKSEKKSKKSSSRRLLSFERKTKENNSQQHTSSDSSLVEERIEPSADGVIKESPGKLKDLKEKWEQQVAENHRTGNSPHATSPDNKQEEDQGHLNVRKQLDLWEHRVTENSPSNGATPRSPAISTRKANGVRGPSSSSSYRNHTITRDDSFETTSSLLSTPRKRNEVRDAFLSLGFAAFMIAVAMLIHQPYGPIFDEGGAFGIFPTTNWVVAKFNSAGEYMQNSTKIFTGLLEKWSSNGMEAAKPPSAPTDARHFLLL